MNKVLDRTKWSAKVKGMTLKILIVSLKGETMRTDIKIAVIKTGRKQFEIAAEAGINELKLSKYIHQRAPLTVAEEKRLLMILGLAQEGKEVHAAG
jgi:hypothetical protein